MLYDVIATQIKSPHTRRKLAERKTEADAEAIIKMAIIRRGVEEEFYTAEPCKE